MCAVFYAYPSSLFQNVTNLEPILIETVVNYKHPVWDGFEGTTFCVLSKGRIKK